nr:DUF4406 domain-containing protein [uncultured Oscillibacter sp.]
MNFFEQELRKLFDDGKIIGSPYYVGQSCFGTLGKDLRARVDLTDNGMDVTVIDRTKGPLDHFEVFFWDLLGRKFPPEHPQYKFGVSPHIWTYNHKTDWYAYHPTDADYETMRQAVAQYLDLFRDRQQERVQDGPQMVYICAPLRGDVEKNIEFARQKAQEVFQAGGIPVCPHLMFPPVADVNDPAQDEAVRKMGLLLVESCQQVHVYGSTITEGMRAEIQRAQDRGIHIVSEQERPQRAQPRKRPVQKGGRDR